MNKNPGLTVSDMQIAEIGLRLKKIEQDYSVSILYACESGSRAWGFASKDSDYDVRYLYVRHPEFYLSVFEPVDVIESAIEKTANAEYDMTGWDIKKVFFLLAKSNSTLIEWLNSPIVYRSENNSAGYLKQLLPEVYQARKAVNHYLGMARKIMFRQKGKKTVTLKSYLYVLRAALCALFIKDTAMQPPVLFDVLYQKYLAGTEILQEVDCLLAAKASAMEKTEMARSQKLDLFISSLQHQILSDMPPAVETKPSAVFDVAFRNTLKSVWGKTAFKPNTRGLS